MQILRVLWLPSLLACGAVTATPLPDAPPGEQDAAPGDAPADATVRLEMLNEPADAAAAGYVVGYRDGDGAWASAPRTSAGHYEWKAPSGRYQIAVLCNGAGGGGGVSLSSFTVAELPSPQLLAGCGTGSATLSGGITVNNATVAVGATSASGSDRYQIAAFPGIYDVMAATYTAKGFDLTANAVLVVPKVAINGATQLDLPFAKAAVAPQSHAVVLALQTNETALVLSSLVSASTTLGMTFQSTAPYTYVTPPPRSDASIVVTALINSSERRAIRQRWVAGDADVSFAAVPAMTLPSATLVSRTPYPRIGAVGALPATADAIGVTASQTGCNNSCSITWTLLASKAYLAAGGTAELPDLSALTGWAKRYELELGTKVNVEVIARQATGGAAGYVAQTQAVGNEQLAISNTLVITP